MKLNTRLRKLIEHSKLAGIEFTEEQIRELNDKYNFEDVAKEEQIRRDTVSREAESVLALVARQELFNYKSCRKCYGLFAANYAKVAYCSDRCRRLALEDIGITWDPTKRPEERWGCGTGGHAEPYPAPLVVPPEALKLFPVTQQVPAQIQEQPEIIQEPEPQPAPSSGEELLDAVLG